MAVKKAKGKEWFTIIAPKIFNSMELGKTMSGNPESLIGRKIDVSLIDLTNDFNKYYMKFIFKIKSIQEDKAITEFCGSDCMRDYISRMILRRIKRVDTVQDLNTKDGITIRVKGLAIIRGSIKSSIRKTIRNKIKELVKAEVEDSTLDEFIEKIISDDTKNKILKETRKIYPVRNFEIRKTELMGPTK